MLASFKDLEVMLNKDQDKAAIHLAVIVEVVIYKDLVQTLKKANLAYQEFHQLILRVNMTVIQTKVIMMMNQKII